MPKLLKLLLIAAFFNALVWIVLIPVWQYPDEQAHFAQVQNLAELGVSSTGKADTSEEIAISEKIFGTERDGFGNNRYTYHPEFNIDYSDTNEGLFENYIESLDKSSRANLIKKEATHNPPLYYFLGSLFYKVFDWEDLFTRVYAVRLMSAILFLTTIFISYKIALIIFKNRLLQIILPTLVAFKPMLVFSSTGVLPDPLTNLLFTLVIYLSLKILYWGIGMKIIIKSTVVIILGILTRQQFLISFPVILLSIIYRLVIDRVINKIFFLLFASVLVLVYFLSFVIPSFFNSHIPKIPEVGRPNLALILNKNFIDHATQTLKHTYFEVMPWYWGVFRWLSFTLPPVIYQIISRLVLFTLIGVIIKVSASIIRRKVTGLDKALYFMIIFSIFYFAALLVWDYYFRLQYGFSFGIQGRYFFPTVIAHLSIILIGFVALFEYIFKKYAKWGFLILALIMIIFNNTSLYFVSTSYYSTENLLIFLRQASQYKPELLKGYAIFFIVVLALLFQAFYLVTLYKFIHKKNVEG